MIGGGIIGLEMATVYDALGSSVTVVELLDQLLPGADKDLIRVLEKRIEGRYEAIHLETGVKSVEAGEDGLHVNFGEHTETFDRMLVAVGRKPERRPDRRRGGGRARRRARLRRRPTRRCAPTSPHIFSIGDVRGEPMLAHKATHEGMVAAEVIAGENVSWDARSIPSVAYTDPEVAWTGLTETAGQGRRHAVEKAVFPWAASGRALSIGRADGLTKLIFEPETHRVLGAGDRRRQRRRADRRGGAGDRGRASTPRTSRCRSTRTRRCRRPSCSRPSRPRARSPTSCPSASGRGLDAALFAAGYR